jgi:DNA repair protein REV1
MSIRDLPGIGWSLEQKCHELHLHTCYDIQHTTLSYLQQHFGVKTGLMLHSYSTGRDDRMLENKTRQSVAVEINWGVRFQTSQQVTLFLQELSVEVFSRLIKTGQSSAGHVTVTIKKKLYEGEPGKFLGCGHCEDISRSVAPSHVITTADSLSVHVLQLYKQINIAVTDVRGIGIHLKNLKGTQMNGSAAIHSSMFEKQPPCHTTNNNKNENTNQWASRDYAYTAITGMCE